MGRFAKIVNAWKPLSLRIQSENLPVYLLRSSPYSVRMRENKDQNNFEYGELSRSEMIGRVLNALLKTNRYILARK